MSPSAVSITVRGVMMSFAWTSSNPMMFWIMSASILLISPPRWPIWAAARISSSLTTAALGSARRVMTRVTTRVSQMKGVRTSTMTFRGGTAVRHR